MDGQLNSSSAEVSAQAFAQRMQARMQEVFCQVMEAVNKAPDGAWINASEHRVRDLFADLRREAYETALQMRLDAAQAAFSPGGQADGRAAAKQGR